MQSGFRPLLCSWRWCECISSLFHSWDAASKAQLVCGRCLSPALPCSVPTIAMGSWVWNSQAQSPACAFSWWWLKYLEIQASWEVLHRTWPFRQKGIGCGITFYMRSTSIRCVFLWGFSIDEFQKGLPPFFLRALPLFAGCWNFCSQAKRHYLETKCRVIVY